MPPHGGRHGVGVETAVRALAHVGGFVVDDLAGVELEPLLPHRHAQEGDVDAGVVHGLELGLERVVALDVVEVLITLGFLENELFLARLHGAQIGDLAQFAGDGAQEAVHDLLVAEQVLGKMVHVDVDDHVRSRFPRSRFGYAFLTRVPRATPTAIQRTLCRDISQLLFERRAPSTRPSTCRMIRFAGRSDGTDHLAAR